jgi:hypothetical protein
MRDALFGRLSIIGATAEWTKERGSSSRTPALGIRRLRRRQRVRLEGGGHKLPRPGEAGTIERGDLEKPLPSFLRDRGFESVFLQQRVRLSRDFIFMGKNPGFRRGFPGCVLRRGRQRAAGPANIAPTRRNISLGPCSSTAFPAMRRDKSLGLKSQGWS